MSQQEVGIGEVIGGYRLGELLGQGSTSQVFLGEHRFLQRQAAIKVVTMSVLDGMDVRQRLLQEAQAVNNIRHPNIADIFDFIEVENPRRLALVMEYVPGPSLKLMRQHRLSRAQALSLALQLVDGVAAAHAAGVIHRDLKPDNLLLEDDPRYHPEGVPSLKIVDFGLAKVTGPGGLQTVAGAMLGTPAYMAPEQIAGRPPPSPATDVFAVGELIYEMFSGDRAYTGSGMSEILKVKLRGTIPDLGLPAPLDSLLLPTIKKCLSFKPADRPSLDELRRVLESLDGALGAKPQAPEKVLPAPQVTFTIQADLASIPVDITSESLEAQPAPKRRAKPTAQETAAGEEVVQAPVRRQKVPAMATAALENESVAAHEVLQGAVDGMITFSEHDGAALKAQKSGETMGDTHEMPSLELSSDNMETVLGDPGDAPASPADIFSRGLSQAIGGKPEAREMAPESDSFTVLKPLDISQPRVEAEGQNPAHQEPLAPLSLSQDLPMTPETEASGPKPALVALALVVVVALVVWVAVAG